MKRFLIWLLLVISGVAAVLLLGGFLLLKSFQPRPVSIKPETILTLRLPAVLTDYAVSPLRELTGDYQLSVERITKALKAASRDQRISAVLLDLEFAPTAYPQLAEIARALQEFRHEGKAVYAYLTTCNDPAYFLAAGADTIWLDPGAGNGIFLRGLGTSRLYWGDFFQRLGVHFQVLHQGRFKGAFENYARGSMSPEVRSNLRELLEDLNSEALAETAHRRRLRTAVLDSLQNKRGELFIGGTRAQDLHLVDLLAARSDLEKELKGIYGNPEFLSLAAYAATVQPTLQYSSLAVVHLEGPIERTPQRGYYQPKPKIHSPQIISLLQKLEKNDLVKGVVLQINSPGGSATASEDIYRAVEHLDAVKPVVCSFSGVAASGGYYIAAAARRIFTHPTTITGSIGVVGLLPEYSALLDTLSIGWESVGTSPFSTFGDPGKPLTPREKSLLDAHLEKMYHQFKERVARGRGLTLEEVEERAQGRVWSGRQALALGLVDSLGTLEDAVDWLADQVGLRPGKYSLRHYPRQRELLELLLEEGRSELVQLLSFRNPLEEFLPDAALLRKWYGRMELPLVIR